MKTDLYTTTVWYTEDGYESSIGEYTTEAVVEVRLHPGKPSKLAKSTRLKGQLTDVVSSEKVTFTFLIYFMI